jgi:tetratricopeptide (TPR) repeat protein
MIEKGRKEFNNSFLSIELGNYYQKRKQFKDAIEEYVLSLFSNPGNSSSVSRRILIMGDDIESKNVIEIKLLEMSNSNPVLILPILSDHYFKHREFKKSFDTLLELTEIENFSAKKWLSFSNNLRREKAYSLAVKAYQFALKKDLKAYQYGEGLLGLAKTFEDQIFPIEKNDIIPFFYNDNIFFEDAFQLYTNISSENLAYSLSIYDSVLTSIPESAIACEAEFRLAEIQYRVMEDFDKALNLYKSSLSKCRSKKLKEQSILKIADVHLSKGDFISSIKFLDSTYSIHDIPEIKNKLIEMYLFSGFPDTALAMINNSFKTIMPTDKYFNDLMELRDFINHYYVKVDDKGKKVFKDYLRSESLLKQRKIFEANQLLEFIQINNNNEIISPLISLRRSIILIRLKKYDDALNQLNTLNGSIYSDRGIIMSGQIHEQFYGESSKALEYYMRIINDYSDSIFSEPIRYHLRKMKKNEKI